MNSVCAWCGTHLGPVDGGKASRFSVTHGICSTCRDTYFKNNDYALRSFLDKLEEPVLVLESNHRVACANQHAEQLLGGRIKIDGNSRFGEIFECENAKLPGGCGRTIHCNGCTIRRCIATTAKTGESQRRVPATLSREYKEAPEVNFYITTEKAQNYILLKIEKA